MIVEFVYVPAILLLSLAVLLFGTRVADAGPIPFMKAPTQPKALRKRRSRPPVSRLIVPAPAPSTHVIDTTTIDPVVITDYAANEPLTIQVPLALASAEADARIAANNRDTEILVAGRTVAILAGFRDLDQLYIAFEATPALAQPEPPAESVRAVFKDGDAPVTVADFNAATDVIEVAGPGAVTFQPTRKGRSTCVLLDGTVIFVIPGQTPEVLQESATIRRLT